MALFVSTCPRFLGVLNEFYQAMPEPPSLEAVLVDPESVPAPYRALLVHQSDMTSTLENYYRAKIDLRILNRVLTDDTLSRHIVLVNARTHLPVEYGAIRINLDSLNERARHQVIEGRIPLGGILHNYGIHHRSCPGGFFKVRSNGIIDDELRLSGPCWLYGRCNCLSNEAGEVIAEVVEILPPASETGD